MSSQGFSFPPPPPPPPPVPQASSATPHGQHWNARGSGRGRGRGQGNRGRGGNHNSNGSRQSYQNTNNGYNYTPGNYGYPTQPVSATSYMPPPYPHTQTKFQQPQNPSSYQPPQTFHQPAGSAAFQPLPHYAGPSLTTPSASFPPQTTPYPPNVAHQHASPPNNPILMNSVPWGAEIPAAPAPTPAPATTPYGGVTHGHPHAHGHGHGHIPRGSWSSHSQGNHNNHGSKPRPQNKRDHSAAFNKPQSSVPRTPAPPAVPSFGNPLPCKPPPVADVTSTTRRPRKRKRKHNQLGLTPKTEEHESSEDEEDVDEESTFAAAGSECAPLQFSYRGKTATLQSSADIAAWIAERKKKFPTKERVEEKKKAIQEAKDAREAARKEKMNEKANENKGKQKDNRKNSDTNPESAMDEAMKAQRKADKIRRNLDREQKRIAKAEAEAEAARLKIAALQKQLGSDERRKETETEVGIEDGNGNCDEAEPKAITSETAEAGAFDPMTLDTEGNRLEAGALTAHANSVPAGADPVANQLDDPMDLSSEQSNASDWTSSSGSDSEGEESGSDNENDSDSDSDSAPEQVSSRRQGPERVLPPPREGKKQLCRHFARSGQCNRGDQCNFSHDVSERERRKVKPEKKREEKEKGRKGILSALLERQKEDEDRRAMEVIVWLGENGLLEEAPGSAPQDIP